MKSPVEAASGIGGRPRALDRPRTRALTLGLAERLPQFALAAVVVVFAALLWSGLPRLGHVPWVSDNIWFERYAQTLDTQGRLPKKSENLEYTLPPGLPATAVGLERAARWLGPLHVRPLGGLPRTWRIALWTVVALLGGWTLLAAGGRRAWRAAGLGLAGLAVVLAALAVLTTATSVAWVPEVLPDLAATVGLVLVSAALAREVWPRERWAPALAAAATALLPVVFRMGLVFHPDPVFALLASLALLLTLRAPRRGWTAGSGAACGVLLGLAALTRQSALVVVVALALVALLLGRRRALRFLAAGAAALALVAGPWWGYQTARYGNPIQSNLDRPGLMLARQPLSFYAGAHGEIVTNPWRTLNRNELFPKFHVSLWSDWSGIGDFGGPYGRNAKSLASSQSVLGLGGDGLVLGGFALVGVPALLRLLRRRPLRQTDAGLAALSILFAVAWAAYVVMLIRFPQRDGDPISAHYLLFLAPACAALGLAAARALWTRGGWLRAALVGWTVLYGASWAMVLALML